jgi:hypothetical protein
MRVVHVVHNVIAVNRRAADERLSIAHRRDQRDRSHRLFGTGRIRLEFGINMNIRREDAEHYQLRVSTEEQLLLHNIVTVMQADPDCLTLTR